MKLNSLLTLVMTLPLMMICQPVLAQDTSTGILPPQQTQPPKPIRVERPLLVEFGGTFPKLPGIGITYNLNEHVALGVHGSYLHFINSVAATGRLYFEPEASTLFAEIDLILMQTGFSYSSMTPGAALMLGYEYRSDNGFTMGAGAGITMAPFGGAFGSNLPLLPALSVSFGHAF